MSNIEDYMDGDSWMISTNREYSKPYWDYYIVIFHASTGVLSWMARKDETGIFTYDVGPGARWTCQEYADLLQTPGEEVWYTAIGKAKIVFKLLQLDWFLPLIQKVAKGESITYEEANDLHVRRFGKPLRLWPSSAPAGIREEFQRNLDYDYQK
jgi:hypothetical protein